MKSRHEAFDDAIHATRAAVAEGVVPEAGLALLRAIPAVEAEAARLEGDERSGAHILLRALEAPARQIAENSGADGGVVVEKMRSGTGNFGFDAAARKYVDLVFEGPFRTHGVTVRFVVHIGNTLGPKELVRAVTRLVVEIGVNLKDLCS